MRHTAVETSELAERLSLLPVQIKKGKLRKTYKEALECRRRLVAEYRRAHRAAAKSSADVTPCTEMFLDEFYGIEKQLMVLLRTLWEAKHTSLPCFTSGELKGRVRIEALADELTKACDGTVDSAAAMAFIDAFQKRTMLLFAELQLLPCMLRLALVRQMETKAMQSDDCFELKNVLLSLKAIDDAPWEECISGMSEIVSQLARNEGFRLMDKQSRSYCVEMCIRMAKRLHLSETVVARRAIELAAAGEGKTSHVGYYLAYEGTDTLMRSLRHRAVLPLAPIEKRVIAASLTVTVTLLLLSIAALFGNTAMLLCIYPAGTVALSICISLFCRVIKPYSVLRLDIKNSLPNGITAAVTMPILLTDEKNVEDSVSRLETHYVANPIAGVEFILLADLPDAESRIRPSDEGLISAAKQGIDKLNAKYGQRFFLLCRERCKNHDGIWQGYERKRGAVMELCALLMQEDSRFSVVHPKSPKPAAYLTILDADTVLPAGALAQLIGVAAHPLNQPELDENARVYSGYTVFAPQMKATARSAASSMFARMVSGDAGASPYSFKVSDFHMDAYREGDFGGKGILNVRMFYRLLKAEIPENRVLSHDLLEGIITRTAFLNDVTLYDTQPNTLYRWWKRQHRWIRGDWQLLPFVFNRKIRFSGRLQMLVNMARSLRDGATLLLIFASVLLDMPFVLFFTLFAYLFEPIKEFIPLAIASLRDSTEMYQWRLLAQRTFMELFTLPYAAIMSLDAIIRTLYRVVFSHRKMLEWKTSSNVKDERSALDTAFYVCSAAMFALAVVRFSALTMHMSVFVSAAILSVMWLTSPIIVRAIDRQRAKAEFSMEETAALLSIFSGTWAFFRELCDEKTNFLPPDNVQERPAAAPVGITSPTNIGMGLLSVVSAYDMGLINADDMAKSVSRIIGTITQAEKWHGNLFNWYRTADLTPVKPRFVSSVDSGNLIAALMTVSAVMNEIGRDDIAMSCNKLIEETDLAALYDDDRKLFRIGYDFEEGRFTNSWYDLYASEARLTSFIAISLGHVGGEHWQRLSRVMTEASGGRTLLSWSGTAFEYLMPLIFFETADGSLQHEISLSAVRTQILDVKPNRPWGVSESGYYCFDRSMHYQYRAFGLPQLALERKRSSQNVISPYSSALALCVEPAAAAENLMLLRELGISGKYGMFEAADYTDGSLRIVASFMAHHQGMTLCAINNALNDRNIRSRFMAIPCVRANETLLFESMPTKPIVLKEYESSVYVGRTTHTKAPVLRTIVPYEEFDGQLLSNGRYSTMVFSNGGGWSKCGEIMLTRWRPSGSPNNDDAQFGVSMFIYTDDVWRCDRKVAFEPHMASFVGGRGSIEARYTVAAAAGHDAEIRTITLINRSTSSQTARVGIFFEPCMVSHAEDMAHPAFVKLCMNAYREGDTVLFRLRGKEGREERWLYATVVSTSKPKLCTDAYIIPSRLKNPKEMLSRGTFSVIENDSPIEPYYSAMIDNTIEAGASKEIAFIMGLAASKEEALQLSTEIVRNRQREVSLIAALTSGMMAASSISDSDAAAYEPLAARIAAEIPYKRYEGNSTEGISGLWRMGLSGDIPIVLVNVKSMTQLPNVRKLCAFARYCFRRELKFDVVILGHYPNEYSNRLRNSLSELANAAPNVRLIDEYAITSEEVSILQDIALICCDADSIPHSAIKIRKSRVYCTEAVFEPLKRRELIMSNSFGGFSKDGQEYVINCTGRPTPAPWSNVIANESFGTLVTEHGGGFTWAGNSRLMRITPWSNDPLRDPCGERVSIVDTESGRRIWLTPQDPNGIYECTHGMGYTRYRCKAEGLEIELAETVDAERPCKYYAVTLKNRRLAERSLSINLEVDWEIGESAHAEAIVTKAVGATVFARNMRNAHDGRFAFITANGGIAGSNRVSIDILLQAGETSRRVFVMGYGDETAASEAAAVVESGFDDAMKRIESVWKKRLGRLQICTDDTAFDVLVNRMLLYQTYSSRLLARAGFYQCGGAMGFRDQLQDVCALLMTDPDAAKKQIYLAASKQFRQGDVLHWWHNDGRGVRTKISDDRLFLPYAVMQYAETTGDDTIWEISAPYIRDIPIPEGKKELYTYFADDGEGSILEHCMAAVEISMELGAHGLPLMGGGDWNDGMNNVGNDGGESVWLGWFLLYVLERFIPVCNSRGLTEKAERYQEFSSRLRSALEMTGWDGAWYRRAVYGDGTMLGSSQNTECSVDCVAQTWAVFCNAVHSKEAFNAVLEQLVDERSGVVRLLAPPFSNECSHNAGYIEAYVEGVRENGGQYTHALAWAVIAAVKLGDAEAAYRMFNMANPIKHGTDLQIKRYAVEPYVVAGDVCSVGENAGRGGWTWYTGAAAWLYRAAVEYILGITKHGTRLYFNPTCTFDSFKATYLYMDTEYEISASRADSYTVKHDGRSVFYVELVDDGAKHNVVVTYK